MQLNQAKFRLNGGCGYVLKPNYMLDDNDNTISKWTDEVVAITLCVMAGRHVGRPSRNGISNPFVTVEVFGDEKDSGVKLNTKTISMLELRSILSNIILVLISYFYS